MSRAALFANGAPDGIRTHGPQIRNLVLYPAELRAPAPPLRCGAAAGNQFACSGGTTGNGSGMTATPSSSNSFASSTVAWP